MGSARQRCTPHCKGLSWLKRQFALTLLWPAPSAKNVTTSLRKIGVTTRAGLSFRSSVHVAAVISCIEKPDKLAGDDIDTGLLFRGLAQLEEQRSPKP